MNSTRFRRTLTGIVAAAAALGATGAFAASHGVMDEMVAQRRTRGDAFSAVALFGTGRAASAAVRNEAADGTVFRLDGAAVSRLRTSAPETLSLAIPTSKGRVVLDLVRVDPFAQGFKAVTSDGARVRDLGLHYRGIVSGEAGSVAAVSVFRNEVMGMAQSDVHGQLSFGRMGGTNVRNDHVAFRAERVVASRPFACGTHDSAFATDERISLARAAEGVSSSAVTTLAGGTVDIYVEADYDVYKALGSAGTTNLITGVFNQSSTLYANEGIPIAMSELYIWTKRSPYKGNSSSQLLASFQKNRTSFNGDLGHLVALRGGGGIAAGFNGFCNANRSQSQAFSMLDTTYANVPTYSWSVMVFTHEMGHLMGSRHTHACVWNGNNTAIDGCYQVEGTCARPGFPSNGGTIMSYCHLQSVGTNFNNGFGQQPGDVIRNRYNAASCVQ